MMLVAVVFAMTCPGKEANAATCTDSLQAKIDAAPPGGTVTANPCVYREKVVIKKSLTLQGQPGSGIRGSNVWNNFKLQNGVYVSANTVPTLPSVHGYCKPNTEGCLWPEQVFIEGKPLEQVATGMQPSAGQFALDSGRHVLLGDNPSGKFVEVSVRNAWIVGGASNVTINGFRMKHAANDSQWKAAVSNQGHANWTLQNNILSDTHGALVSFQEASGLKILNNELYRGGQLAVHSTGAYLTLSGNKIHGSNASAFKSSWEAGGFKGSMMKSVLAENNQVYNNDGRGLWCDGDCANVTFRANRLHHNTHSGIFFEISQGAKIHGNVLYENGWGKEGTAVGAWEAAIQIYNSRNTEIYNNVVAWNRAGISVVRTDRRNTLWNDVYGIYARDNQILSADYASSAGYNSATRNLALAWVDGMVTSTAATGSLFDPAKNNRGYSNDYFYTTLETPSIPRFKWGDGITSLSAFNATRGEEGGRYLSVSEKNSLVTNRGIPAYPQH